MVLSLPRQARCATRFAGGVSEIPEALRALPLAAAAVADLRLGAANPLPFVIQIYTDASIKIPYYD